MPPKLIHWEMLWDSTPSSWVQLQNSYEATCTIYPDGTLSLKSDPEGALRRKPDKLRALIDEAEEVARHYYGDQWGT